MKRKNLHETKHQFDVHPFEALCCGSWQSVKLIEIREGVLTMQFANSSHQVDDNGPYSNLRVKSRQATLTDCTCFLRPGIDVCVLSSPEKTDSSKEENPGPVWIDARIKSIERKPHDSQCSCQFFVNFYVNQGPLGSEKATISKDTKELCLDQIFILQRLEKEPCKGRFYRWYYSEDCSQIQKTKLFLGKFSCELTWLLVASITKQIAFNVRSIENKIVYQILDGDDDDDDQCSSKSNNHLNSINFKVDNGVLVPNVVQFVPGCGDPKPIFDTLEPEAAEPLTAYNIMNLRRSKRRNVQPERFLGCDSTSNMDVGWVRSMPYTPDKWKEEDLYLPLSCLFGTNPSGSPEEPESETEESFDDVPVSKLRTKSRGRKSVKANQQKHENQLSIVPMPPESDLVRFGQLDSSPPATPRNFSQKKEVLSFSTSATQRKNNPESEKVFRSRFGGKFSIKRAQSGFYTAKSSSSSQRKYNSELEEMVFGHKYGGKASANWAYASYYCTNRYSSSQKKKSFELDDMVFVSKWGGKSSSRKCHGGRYRPLHSKRDDSGEPMTYKKTTLSAGAYNKLINSYMKNIDSTIMAKKETHIIDQWEQFKAKAKMEQREKSEQSAVEEEEMSETEMLWKEMEISLAQAYLLEEGEARVSGQAMQNSSESCQHDFRLDEEIGILCRICGTVKTEIKYVSAPFLESAGWVLDNKQAEENLENKPDEDEGLNLFSNQASVEETPLSEEPLSEENDNVWALIPGLRKKLHLHQKKAFEFLWKNMAGSLNPALMEKKSRKIGGCVVSHTPGAGKTFLIIAFLSSYLKLFPGKRPLVLAPKTTLYTWYKEFIKWEIPIPVHLIHGRRTYRVFQQNSIQFRGPKPSQDVMHVLDCLEKIQKWHAQPSVLVMGYTSFLTLMREDSKFAHRKYMAKELRESPGLLILDEGHNPRSTKSRLRKVLMKVDTDLRILLSGTLFQNNFCEYFNTLCLARPKFIREVLRVLDPKFKRKKKQKAAHLLESRARKFFLDNIAKKIDSNVSKERIDGLNMLRKITNGFIDVYEGGASDGLPGLQIYTILMNSTDIQNEVLVKLRKTMSTYHGYPLELELLITLASIHPWLVKTSNCVNKFFNTQELMELERIKSDFRKGSKIMFVLNLVYRVVKNEKVLIFCHNIAPITLFLQLFETVFRWQKGKEILVLTGDLELFERGRVMDKFEEPGGPSRILLASITACAEGISLTAASRVILLDSEWNPSKTKQAIARAFRPGQQKVVYVYQLLATGTLEEDKYRRTTWKEWVSCMIFSEAFVEDPSLWQAEKIEDDVLREMVEEDRVKSFHMIMKNEKASTG